MSSNMNNMMAILLLASAMIMIGALVAIPIIEQEAQARGPPAKAQAILSADPHERGTIASGGCGHGCG